MEKSIQEIKSSKSIYNSLNEVVYKNSTPSKFSEFQKTIQGFLDKNSDVLQTNIIGKQLLLNQDLQDKLLSFTGLSRDDIETAILNSPWFKSLGNLSLKDQIVWSIGISLFSSAYLKKGKEHEARYIYLTMFFKPYASRISQYFRYGVNESQMLYTIEHLSNRFDIKNEGTVFSLLKKMSDSSFENYKQTLKGELTDYELYTIATSGCYSRVNLSVQNIMREYMNNKSAYMKFEANQFTSTDEDSEGEIIDKEIQSKSQQAQNIISKAINKLIKTPIDEKSLFIAGKFIYAKTGSAGQFGRVQMENLKIEFQEILDKKLPELKQIISGIVFGFISTPIDGKKYTVADISSPVFVPNALKLFRQPNSKNNNVLEVRDGMDKLLNDCSRSYSSKSTTTQRFIRDALIFYLILIIRG